MMRPVPEGFFYFEEVISEKEEKELIAFAESLEYHPYVMRGQASKRGLARFGFDYGVIGEISETRVELPDELLFIRERVTSVADLPAKDFISALVTRYPPGAGIGWHRDITLFGPAVIGLSFGSACLFKLRPKTETRRTLSLTLQPRSQYVLSGAAREEWEHSIPAVATLRYSVTFRTLKKKIRRSDY